MHNSASVQTYLYIIDELTGVPQTAGASVDLYDRYIICELLNALYEMRLLFLLFYFAD